MTYSHHMEEPDNLEISYRNTVGTQRGGNGFSSSLLEFEYGARRWWTTSLYLAGQTTFNESTVFTGFRWENRFRALPGEHWINPVIYVEYMQGNEADKSFREIAGNDMESDTGEPAKITHGEKEKELELKLILSSNVKGWNISENFIAEKNLANEPWGFGYAWGASRPLSLQAAAKDCRLCAENFQTGVEMFGGLGTRASFGLKNTSHYLAPVVAWQATDHMWMKFSPAFGLNGNSHRALFRMSVTYEIDGIGSKIGNLFRGKN
ncbi:MAG: hypothetical protein HYX26_08555 [Acidobacteriales bacterium]|nr:hypothetical protein [Terriglobales bacterium]